jgi:sporulation protein YlmC with PRC-barrel domain
MNDISPRAELLRTRDFIGRDVVDAKAEKVGTVAELLLDRRRGDVRMIAVNLGVFQKTVLIPVNQLDLAEDVMVMRHWRRDQLKPLPTYEPDRPLTPALLEEMERAHPRFYGSPDRVARMGPSEGRVVPLRETREFRLAKGDPDLRGWNVFGADGERIGTVSDLLVDPAVMKVRYLDVDLSDDLFRLKEDRHVIVPTESVDLRERGKDVWIRTLGADDVAQLPAYTGGALDPVPHRVFHERLQGQHRHDGRQDLRRHLQPHPEAVAEAGPLQVQVLLDVVELVGQRHVRALAAERVARELGEVREQLARLLRPGVDVARHGRQRAGRCDRPRRNVGCGTVFINAHVSAPGVVTSKSEMNTMYFGELDNRPSERAQRLRSEQPDFFEQYGPEAREILEELLDKYTEHGTAQFVIPDVLQVPPISSHGNVVEIATRFGGVERLRQAVMQLQTLLYAAA